MIQIEFLTNFKVLLHFLPEIHLETLPPNGIKIILFFWMKVIQILLKCFEQHKLKVRSRLKLGLDYMIQSDFRILLSLLNNPFSRFDPIPSFYPNKPLTTAQLL